MRRHFAEKILALASVAVTGVLLTQVLFITGGSAGSPSGFTDVRAAFEQSIGKRVGSILENEIPVQETTAEIYTLNDYDLTAPVPQAQCFGEVTAAKDMAPVQEKAQSLLQGEKTLFTPDTVIKEGSTIHYYLDKTIYAVTWKQVVDDGVYTFSEVKLAHPSQFRRFFSEGTYGSSVLHTTTEMSESVNAVVAASGDYYSYREIGIVVNDGHVYRDRGHLLDTCYIDDKGDLLFSYAGDMTDTETIQRFVEEHNIRFSLCFGPVMILDGEYRVPRRYNSGEINKPYARAALCQMGPLHYVVVTANNENPNYNVPTVAEFGRRLQEMGIPTAYALDGGQTASIVMNNQLINSVSYGSQRKISDILYFATALPEGAAQEGMEE